MARRHGRKGRLYVAIASGGTAEPITFLNKWKIEAATDDAEVTAFGDENKVYVSGLPDASGDYAGFWDSESPQLYTAARDGIARKFYLYPSTDPTDVGVYWFGTGLFDAAFEGDVGDAVKTSGNWKAASNVFKVG